VKKNGLAKCRGGVTADTLGDYHGVIGLPSASAVAKRE